MDNLGSHRSKAVRQLIRSAGAKLFFLPKYSPDLNPIEQVFAKLKHLLRKAAARTVDAVCAAIGELLDAFTPQECHSACNIDPRIAASADVTLMVPVQQSIRCRLIDRAR